MKQAKDVIQAAIDLREGGTNLGDSCPLNITRVRQNPSYFPFQGDVL